MKKVVATLLLMAMALMFCFCAVPEKSIVGEWTSKVTVLGVVTETTYTFNDDGTGSISNVLDIAFTYAFEDEKLVMTMSILGMESSIEYDYSFKGDTLVLTSEGESVTLEKVK